MAKRNRVVFTEENIRTLPMKREQYRVWDGGNGRGSGAVARGLCVLVSPKGTRSFRSTFYINGSTAAQSRHLGRVGEMTLDEARRQCLADRANAIKGIDPRVAGSASDAFEDVVRDYVKRHLIGNKGNKSAPEVERLLLRVCEAWKARPVASIEADEIQALLESIRDGDADHKPRRALANAVYNALATLFKWAAKKANGGKVPSNRMLDVEKPAPAPKGQHAGRWEPWFEGELADEAIRSLWHAAPRLEPELALFVRLDIVLGKRKGDLCKLEWQQIGKDWFWSAPPGEKNKRLHAVPLPSLAQKLLAPHRQPSGFVFPTLAAIDGRGKPGIASAKWDVRVQKAAKFDRFGRFGFHGVRHIVETKLAECKVPSDIRDMLLDHKPARGSGRIYDHHAYKAEMLAGLEAWCERIEALTKPHAVAA